MIQKKYLKILRYVNRHKSVNVPDLFHKYPDAKLLMENGYFIVDKPQHQDLKGFQTGYSSDTSCRLSDKAVLEVEQNQWLDLRYVLTMIIVPIVVGVASAVITNLIMSLI